MHGEKRNSNNAPYGQFLFLILMENLQVKKIIFVINDTVSVYSSLCVVESGRYSFNCYLVISFLSIPVGLNIVKCLDGNSQWSSLDKYALLQCLLLNKIPREQQLIHYLRTVFN